MRPVAYGSGEGERRATRFEIFPAKNPARTLAVVRAVRLPAWRSGGLYALVTPAGAPLLDGETFFTPQAAYKAFVHHCGAAARRAT